MSRRRALAWLASVAYVTLTSAAAGLWLVNWLLEWSATAEFVLLPLAIMGEVAGRSLATLSFGLLPEQVALAIISYALAVVLTMPVVALVAGHGSLHPEAVEIREVPR